MRLGRLRPDCFASRCQLQIVMPLRTCQRQGQSQIERRTWNRNSPLSSRCRFCAAHGRKCTQVKTKWRIGHSGIQRATRIRPSVCIYWRRIRLSNSVQQETNANCDEQHAESRCPSEHRMGLSPYRQTSPKESPPRFTLRLQLSEQFRVALEARRTNRQVLGDCGLTFVRVERERSECSVRGASLAVRVRKGLRKIGARKVE